MSNVMSLKSFQNNVKRNGFDLSFKNAFTVKAGEILPVFCKEVIPGDKFKISGQSFTRTQPVMSAAFVRMREYYDFFFVPYRLLWNRFPTFFTNLPDYHQAQGINTPVEVGDQHPYFTDKDVFDYLEKLDDQEASVKNNLFGLNRVQLTQKLLDSLGYGRFPLGGDYSGENLVLNPFPLFAYQKICQDFFRDDQWEEAAPYKYNVDYIADTINLHIPIEFVSLHDYNMFDMNYCNYPKDYFMGMLPSAQYGDEAFVPLGGSSGSLSVSFDESKPILGAFNMFSEVVNPVSNNDLTWDMSTANNSKSPFQDDEWPTPSVPDGYASSILNNGLVGNDSQKVLLPVSNPKFLNDALRVSGGSSAVSRLSILALRQAEALQKWKEIAQSGKQDYRTQMQKHFNVTPSDAMSHHCEYLGGWTSNIDINEVVNTTLVDETSQADIHGKGVGVGKGSIDFDAKEHGILIGVYHCIPLLDYGIESIHKFNMKSHYTDYAIPEFDSVGMQQLSPYELVTDIMSPDEFPTLGWVPRYADYKTSFDEVHGAFNDTLQYWVARLTPDYLKSYFTAVKAKYGSNQITYEFFKVNPSILDNLFGINADGSVNTDQFLVNSFFDTKVVRNLDYNGLPY